MTAEGGRQIMRMDISVILAILNHFSNIFLKCVHILVTCVSSLSLDSFANIFIRLALMISFIVH